MVIHGLIPTNDMISQETTNHHEQLPTLRSSRHSDSQAECSEGVDIWRWTRSRIASILHMDPKYVLREWTVRPSFHFWSTQRHRAILWILAHMVYHRTEHWHRVSTVDCADFIWRAGWKAYQTACWREKVGNCLEIL